MNEIIKFLFSAAGVIAIVAAIDIYCGMGGENPKKVKRAIIEFSCCIVLIAISMILQD